MEPGHDQRRGQDEARHDLSSVACQLQGRRANFDRVAGAYDGLAGLVFGQRLRLAERHWLAQIPGGGVVAILGGGSGSILDGVVERLVDLPSRVYYVDSSAEMIRRARRRSSVRDEGPLAARIEFIHQPAETWQPPLPLDALVTPYFLDCFDGDTLDRIIDHLGDSLRPGGLWLVSDFRPATNRLAGAVQRSMFAFFQITCGLRSRELADYPTLIADRGFDNIADDEVPTIAGAVHSSLLRKRHTSSATPDVQSSRHG